MDSLWSRYIFHGETIYRLDEERSPAEAIEKEQEHLPRPRLQQAPLPVEAFPNNHDLPEDSRCYHDEERQYLGRPREDQYGQSSLQYQVNQGPPQHGVPRPYRRGSRDTAGEKILHLLVLLTAGI